LAYSEPVIDRQSFSFFFNDLFTVFHHIMGQL
jgi:hypothetical protein